MTDRDQLAALVALADEARDRQSAFPRHPHWEAWRMQELDLRAAIAETRARLGEVGVREVMDPSTPYPLPGFGGCTDRDPDHCACATDADVVCHECEQVIEPGEMVRSVQWPLYAGIPLDSADQDWDVFTFHDTCLTTTTHATDWTEEDSNAGKS